MKYRRLGRTDLKTLVIGVGTWQFGGEWGKRFTQQSEAPSGVPMAPWALAWCLQHPAVSCVIPGTKTVDQLESSARAADLDLVRDDHPQAWTWDTMALFSDVGESL